MRYTVLLLSLSVLVACKTNPGARREFDRKRIETELMQETSLKADRAHLEGLRKEVPQDKKVRNDEMALFLEMMNQGTEHPAAVREKFQSLVTKRRSSFRERVQRLRDDYRSEETKSRDEFLNKQKSKRESFLRRSRDGRETRDFFGKQERERLDFFADERARRQSFEAEINARTKDFDSYMRERQREFDEQYRLYSKQYSAKPKEKKAVTGDEFKRLDEAPASPLGTEE